MKIQFILLVSFIIVSISGIQAQENLNNRHSKYTISGYIKDASTGEILIGATVYIQELENGVISNSYGYYSVTIPEGEYTMLVSYVGYESAGYPIAVMEDVYQDIKLHPSSIELEAVVFQANIEELLFAPEIGVHSIDLEKLNNQPSLLGEPDLIKGLLTLPGVNNVGEGASGFNVQGGNIDQNLILLDEAPIYNSSHLFGFFSVFNSDAIKSAKLYKGIPARYGGRVSSVLDVYQKDGNDDHFGGSLQLGVLVERVMIEGPTVRDKGSFLVAGRVFNPLLSLLIPSPDETDDGAEDKTVLGFYDVNAKINHKLSESNKLFLSFYSGGDRMQLEFADEGSTLKWGNQTTTLRWNKIFNPQLFSNFTALVSNYKYRFEEKAEQQTGIWQAGISNFTLKSEFTYFLSPDYVLEFGTQVNYIEISPGKVTGSLGTFNINQSQSDESERALESSAYISMESQLTKNLLLQSGLRYTFYGLLGEAVVNTYATGEPLTVASTTGKQKFGSGEWVINYSGFEPRLLLSYQLFEKLAMKVNYQRTYQYMQQISNTSSTLPIDIWKLSDTYVKPLYSDMYSGSLYWANNRLGVQASVGGYYKTLKNFIEYKNAANLYANSHIETELLSGKGKAYGLEAFFKMKNEKNSVELAYTYSRTIRNVNSTFREEQINQGKDYPSNFDQPHILSLSVHHLISTKWSVNALFTYKSGRPITLPGGRFVLNRIDKELTQSEIISNPTVIVYEYFERNNYRIPSFHRLDLSFGLKPVPKGKTESEWSFGVYNLYGRKNAFSIAFSARESGTGSLAKKISIIGIPVPYVSYSFKF